ncbi:MAG: conjugative transposon protein TraK [Dysgonamonadaceae bacterium]|jgi:conjugative transposon TraK protein|nr:conjugative transposon protein TraK [Dysgonamonadaceae bacterium]
MLIKNIENKIKLALFIAVASLVTSVIIVVVVMSHANRLIMEERQSVYVLDAGLPLLVQRSFLEDNEEVEGMSHVNMFHLLFFNLPPDEKYIQNNILRSMYLIDESGARLYNDLREQGFYNQLVANSTMVTIKADSISFDVDTKRFRYLGTQRIERPTSIAYRSLQTEGTLTRVRRSEQNPHGFIIHNFKVLKNEDIESRQKRQSFGW